MIPYPECTRYRVLTMESGIKYHAALYTNPRLAPEIVKEINVNIGIRSDVIADMLDIPGEMSTECRHHFKPDSTLSMGFSPLTLTVLSGAFGVIPIMFIVSVGVFLGEKLFEWQRNKKKRMANLTENKKLQYTDNFPKEFAMW